MEGTQQLAIKPVCKLGLCDSLHVHMSGDLEGRSAASSLPNLYPWIVGVSACWCVWIVDVELLECVPWVSGMMSTTTQ